MRSLVFLAVCTGRRQSPRVVKGAASATRNIEHLCETFGRAIRGNSPPEEGGATLATSNGPICYRQMGVAPTDGRRPFDSWSLSRAESRGSLRPFDSFI